MSPPSESVVMTLESTFTGLCPSCERRFELGYAVLLPVHPRPVATDERAVRASA